MQELRAEYKRQAVLGDKITPIVYKVNGREMIVSLNAEDGKPYAIVQFFV